MFEGFKKAFKSKTEDEKESELTGRNVHPDHDVPGQVAKEVNALVEETDSSAADVHRKLHEDLDAVIIRSDNDLSALDSAKLYVEELAAVYQDQDPIEVNHTLLQVVDEKIKALRDAERDLSTVELQRLNAYIELRDHYRENFDDAVSSRDEKQT